MKLHGAIFVHVGRSFLKSWGVGLLNVVALGIVFAAAVIIALYVRDELEFDCFIPHADKILALTVVSSPPNSQVVSTDKAPAGMASWLRADAPAVDAITRIHPVEWSVRSPRFQTLEHLYWADANFFDVVQL